MKRSRKQASGQVQESGSAGNLFPPLPPTGASSSSLLQPSATVVPGEQLVAQVRGLEHMMQQMTLQQQAFMHWTASFQQQQQSLMQSMEASMQNQQQLLRQQFANVVPVPPEALGPPGWLLIG